MKAAVDWDALEAKARAMTSMALRGAVRDIQATLPMADALDRALGGDRGGAYRDEASVYHAELRRRERAAKGGVR